MSRVGFAFCCLLMAMVALAGSDSLPAPDRAGYVIVTDFIPADGTVDVADQLQKIIDDNPNRTIFFPDGVYLLGHPIVTPAHPTKSVELRLSNYAIVRATPDWTSEEAMVRLGGKDFANNIMMCGSNYAFEGGIVDGSKVACGISIDGGRETVIRNVSIKNVRIGIHIKRGANSGSSDSDIFGVNIVGNGAKDAIGVWVEGYDNTFSNMRIANVHIGMKMCASGNSLRNIHPLYTSRFSEFDGSIGFWDMNGNNWYSFCYSDQFQTAFRMGEGVRSIYENCFAYWYSGKDLHLVGVQADGAFLSIMDNLRLGFHGEALSRTVLKVDKPGGTGVFDRLLVNPDFLADKVFESYLQNGIL